MAMGTLFIITAPSGTGKTSLVSALLQEVENIMVSVSFTTRLKRVGEEEGVSYHFIDQNRFDQMIKEGHFLEHAHVFSHSYGTSRDWVLEKLVAGIDVILEIDWQGAQQVRQQMPQAVSIFIAPPTQAIVLDRLRKRGQDGTQVIEERMAAFHEEMLHYKEFDYFVINDKFSEALADLISIIRAERLRVPRQQLRHEALFNQLLG